MGCEGCGTKGSKPSGCGNNGHCESGGCSRLEVYDWLSDISSPAHEEQNIHEVSFKNGARKEFFHNPQKQEILTGDYVLVETGSMGYDIGRVSMSGELVKLQILKKGGNSGINSRRGDTGMKAIIRKAREKELEKMVEARSREKETMLRARIMARSIGLDMKLGDVEFQADLRKATFFYTADERIDFRQLIKDLAQEFRVKIEMRQIGTRQEAGRVGGIGACGRELCCSTWLTSFKSVNTGAARYQNLAINQTKLSGQCGRLKCCLNYELDTYLDALRAFPEEAKARKIMTAKGEAFLVKTDVLKGLMTYVMREGNNYYPLSIDDVKSIIEMNDRGERPEDLDEMVIVTEEKELLEFEDVVGQISLQTLEKADRRKKQRNRNRNKKKSGSSNRNKQKPDGQKRGGQNKSKSNKPRDNKEGGGNRRKSNKRRRPPRGKGPGDGGGSKPQS
ncbi:MAG: hypothetical protein GY751_11620 [Bacteroidetes bacterium]|nr:hypothetical protein [Bacteroidota bacterium]